MNEPQAQADDAIDMNLVGEMMLLYLSVGSTLGECALYRRIGDALQAKDTAEMERIRDFVDGLPGDIKQRIIQGPDYGAIDFEEITAEDLDDIEALADAVRDIA
ncbi:MAG: hypothetical protein HY342_03390 [Candidatus Lambdaproteobacteria bacterium]|nr:hypothetical protein [Candidatus Lambdaproteobacteria bacterium]